MKNAWDPMRLRKENSVPTGAALAVLALGLCAFPLFSARRPKAPLGRLARLYEESRFFELRDALASMGPGGPADLEFFRAAVDQVFDRLDPAVAGLETFIRSNRNAPPRMLTKEAWVLLADAYRRLGRYRQAAEAYRQAFARFGGLLDAEERAGLESQFALWAALAGAPPQTVEVAGDTRVRMKARCFPVRIGGRAVLFGYDTGSNVSILYKSVADAMGLAVHGPPVEAQTGTGLAVRGRMAILPELGWGSVRVANVLVMVLPDELFPPEAGRSDGERKGLLGMPVLAGLKEVTETREGDLIVPARPQPRSLGNMCFSGFMPVVEAVHRGARLLLCLDTGATATSLFPPYYRRFRGELNSRARLRESTVGGVGDRRSVDVRILDEFDFRAGGRTFALRRVLVQTEATHSDSLRFHGAIGTDLLAHCSRMTLDFVSMSFAVE